MNLIFLALAFTFNAAANVLLKIGAQHGFQTHGNLLEMLRGNSASIAGLLLFALNVVFYFLALRSVPLSVAYPIMTIMSFIIINSVAYFYLNENINSGQLAGYGFLVVGLFCIFYFSDKMTI